MSFNSQANDLASALDVKLSVALRSPETAYYCIV
jgi:hypothetical protein